jgi:hypothetical protein
MAFELDHMPDKIDDIRYSVLDHSDKNNVDYIFQSLVFLEIFNSPAAILKIGKNLLKMPLDWNIIVCDSDAGEPEVVPITALNSRGFKAFCFNPLTGFVPSFIDVDIVSIYNDVKWYSPKLKHGHFLTTPINDDTKPLCSFFIRDTLKVSDILDRTDLW